MLDRLSFNNIHNWTMNHVVNANNEPFNAKRIVKQFSLNVLSTATATGATAQNFVELIGRTAITPIVWMGVGISNKIQPGSGQRVRQIFNEQAWLETAKKVVNFAAAIFTSLAAVVSFNSFNIRMQEQKLHTFIRPSDPLSGGGTRNDKVEEKSDEDIPPPPSDFKEGELEIPMDIPPTVTQDVPSTPSKGSSDAEEEETPGEPAAKEIRGNGFAEILDLSPLKPGEIPVPQPKTQEMPRSPTDEFTPYVRTPSPKKPVEKENEDQLLKAAPTTRPAIKFTTARSLFRMLGH